MPVTYSVDPNIDEPSKKAVGEALETLYGSQLFNDLLQDVTSEIKFTSEGIRREALANYNQETKDIRVDPYTGDSDNILTSIIHELTHAAQYQSSDYFKIGNYPRRKISPELSKEATEQGINYGAGELEAFLASNLRKGAPRSDNAVSRVLEKFPEEVMQLMAKTAQPMRAPVDHRKGYPEMSGVEKLMYKMFGYAATVDKKGT